MERVRTLLTQRSFMSRAAIVLALAAVALGPAAAAAKTVRRSGTVVGVDPTHETMTLEEMGPWTLQHHGPMKRVVHLTAATKIELVARSKEPHAALGEFTASPLKASSLHPGDYATITTEGRNSRLTAVSVEVVRPARD